MTACIGMPSATTHAATRDLVKAFMVYWSSWILNCAAFVLTEIGTSGKNASIKSRRRTRWVVKGEDPNGVGGPRVQCDPYRVRWIEVSSVLDRVDPTGNAIES